jgi:hypothetical protein
MEFTQSNILFESPDSCLLGKIGFFFLNFKIGLTLAVQMVMDIKRLAHGYGDLL